MAPPSAPSEGTIPRSAAVNRSVLLRLGMRGERDAGGALPLPLDDAPLALRAAGEAGGGGARRGGRAGGGGPRGGRRRRRTPARAPATSCACPRRRARGPRARGRGSAA